MAKLLTAGQSISLIDQIKNSVNEFSSREKAIIESRDHELKSIRHKFGLENARFKQQAEAESQKVTEALRGERQRLEERFAARKERIEQAYHNAQATYQEVAEQNRSQKKYENQKKLLQANRVHDAEIQTLDKTKKSYLSELSDETKRLEVIGSKGWQVFNGYGTFKKWLQSEEQPTQDELQHTDEHTLLNTLRSHLGELESLLSFSAQIAIARLFSFVSIWLVLICIGILGAFSFMLPQVSGFIGVTPDRILLAIGVFGGIVVFMYGVGFLLARNTVRSFVDLFVKSTGLIQQCQLAADNSRDAGVSSARKVIQEIEEQLEVAWNETDMIAADECERKLEKLSLQRTRLLSRHEGAEVDALNRLSQGNSSNVKGGASTLEGGLNQIADKQKVMEADVVHRFDRELGEVVSDWCQSIPTYFSSLTSNQEAAKAIENDLFTSSSKGWEIPESGEPSGCFGQLVIDWSQVVKAVPVDSKMTMPADESIRIPLVFKMPLGESVLFESEGPAPEEMIDAINHTLLELLLTSPVGRLRFTLMDPVGLGKNFAGLMHLADYDDQLINRRIWTQPGQIEQCLKDLTEHMEKVTQMYLRNEYDTLAQYNQAAGNIAEKYHILVVSDFPTGFSDSALRRLHNIAMGGARCGVFMIMHRDSRQSSPDDSLIDDIRKHSVWIKSHGGGYKLGKHPWDGARIEWNRMFEHQETIDLIHQIGRASVDSNRVEVPFSHVMPKPDEYWTLDTSTSLKVPIGRTGASKLQYLTLGKGTQQHALIAGKTGSGKSTLFHVIATNLALWCSPEQVEFYLIDFKKGVEFKCYASHQVPHAKVVAIESDREFGLSVLERVDQELRRRGDLFREKSVQDLAGYRTATGSEPLPRTLLMIDEFQEYFVEDDHVAQNAAVLLDRIVRQGRAFGIHVILGSQTLGGAYTLARTTFAQMAVRIALQCDEADSYLIMDENNAAPRLLSRPGEGIYNNSSGAVEGNSPFQTVWLTDEERDSYLQQVTTLAQDRASKGPGPVVFEGNAPADIRENHELAAALTSIGQSEKEETIAWLGAPNSIKGPTGVLFGRQSGSHLLIAGQNEEMAFSMVISSLISIASQRSPDRAEFIVLDTYPDHSSKRELMDQVVSMLPHRVRTLKEDRLEEIMSYLETQMDQRSQNGNISEEIYFIVIGLQLFKKLKPEDEFSFSTSDAEGESKPGVVLDRIIREGASAGIRIIASLDSYNSSQRYLNRKALSEFELRVLFQMSANDSAALIDHTKASQLGLHRALFYNERRGSMEVFRPYALPDGSWLSEVCEQFKNGSPLAQSTD